MNYIAKISLDENALVRGNNNKRERDLIITDLLENSNFSPVGTDLFGPYSLTISIVSNKFFIAMEGSGGNNASVEISIMPLKRVIKDYSIICASYFDAVKNSEPRKVEAIDMGRRGVHNEGAEILQHQVSGKLDMDFETARKIFTLIYLLQEK